MLYTAKKTRLLFLGPLLIEHLRAHSYECILINVEGPKTVHACSITSLYSLYSE